MWPGDPRIHVAPIGGQRYFDYHGFVHTEWANTLDFWTLDPNCNLPTPLNFASSMLFLEAMFAAVQAANYTIPNATGFH